MDTKASYIQLLDQQLEAIENRDFDLNAWKKSTILLVSSCFGSHSHQVAAIEKIDYAYSSWSLRDESGTSDPVKTDCKLTLKTIIEELKLQDQSSTEQQSGSLDFLWAPFEDELTGATFKQLKNILSNANLSDDEIEMFLKNLPSQTVVNIIKSILLSSELKKHISQ